MLFWLPTRAREVLKEVDSTRPGRLILLRTTASTRDRSPLLPRPYRSTPSKAMRQVTLDIPADPWRRLFNTSNRCSNSSTGLRSLILISPLLFADEGSLCPISPCQACRTSLRTPRLPLSSTNLLLPSHLNSKPAITSSRRLPSILVYGSNSNRDRRRRRREAVIAPSASMALHDPLPLPIDRIRRLLPLRPSMGSRPIARVEGGWCRWADSRMEKEDRALPRRIRNDLEGDTRRSTGCIRATIRVVRRVTGRSTISMRMLRCSDMVRSDYRMVRSREPLCLERV